MAIDPRIALGVQPFQMPLQDPNAGMNRLASMMKLTALGDESDMNRLKAQEYKSGLADKRTLNELYAGSIGPDGKINRTNMLTAAAQRGAGSLIPGLNRQFLDEDKEQAELASRQADLRVKVTAFHRDRLSTVQTPQQAAAWVAAQYKDPVLGPMLSQHEPLESAVSGIPTDPQQFNEWRQREALGMTEFIKQNKPSYQTRSSGQVDEILAIPGLGGAPKVISSVQRVMTPGEVATDQRGREQLSISRGQLGVARDNLGVSRDRLQLERDKEARERGGEQSSGGTVLGVPTPGVLPWANQTTPKDANKVKAQEISRGAKEVEKDVDAAAKLQATARDAQRFLELNSKIPTGGLVDKMALTRWAQSMGPEYAEMESITARLAPAMREPGSGSTSDFDGKQFERATVGVDKPKKANENIAKAVVARAQQAQEYAEFRQTYLEQNGTLLGADRYWKQYANANPIFDPEKPGAFELNSKRKAWTQHFKAETSKPTPKPAGNGKVVDFGSLKD